MTTRTITHNDRSTSRPANLPLGANIEYQSAHSRETGVVVEIGETLSWAQTVYVRRPHGKVIPLYLSHGQRVRIVAVDDLGMNPAL